MFYCVYLAYSKYEVLDYEQAKDPNIPMYPPELAKVRAYYTKHSQVECFANTMCPASQVFEAATEEEVNNKIEEFKKNFVDPEWLKINIEPYI